jgi:prophage tail gpP-like protein
VSQPDPKPSRVRLELDDYQSGATIVMDGWQSYELPSDMMSAAQNFTFTPAPTQEVTSALRTAGQVCRAYVDDLLQLTGIVETVKMGTKNGFSLGLAGRDLCGLLVDDCPPMITLKNLTLGQLAENMLAQHSAYVKGIRLSNEANVYQVSGKRVGRTLKKFSGMTQERRTVTRTRPEDRIWDTLVQIAQEAGAHVWMSCDGYLTISAPNYAADPSIYGDGLYVLCDSNGNETDSNCVIEHSPSLTERSAQYIVLGQGAPAATSQGRDLAEHTFSVRDPSPAFWERSGGTIGQNRIHKLAHQSVKNISDKAHVRHVARARMETRAVSKYGMTVTVPGHRLNNASPLWAVDTQVRVRFDHREIDSVHYVRSRTFGYSDGDGQTTTLNLIPSGIWLSDLDLDDASYEKQSAQKVWW